MTAVMEIRGLTKKFGAIVAVDDLSFQLNKGELLALIGPNGAGKSTCFNMLTGQQKVSAGNVLLDGEDITGLRPREVWRQGVGRTFQITATYSSMTVVENVQMALLSHHRETLKFLPYAAYKYRDEAYVLLDMVNMRDQAERHCAVLAYGDLKRMELAIALAHKPKVLLMDEPTAGMAPKERVALMQLTADIVKDQGVSVLFTEHDMDVVFANSHRIMVLNRGQLIAEGNANEIRNNLMVQEVYLGGGTVFASEKESAHA
ncbi:MAG: ABC transporter ATP-binding protein [Rhodobacteraceae bacterium]|nr:ABC transporter ATP-binding protein [Paracoccaceae bacterium]